MTKKVIYDNIPQLVRELFIYDDGTLIWKNTKGRIKGGTVAGSIHDTGYVRIKINNRSFYRSNLIWAYHNDEYPSLEIDHINRIRTDDRIKNLRKLTTSKNQHNKLPNKRPKNPDLPPGIKPQLSGGYQVRISIDGKRITLGTFTTIEEAGEVYQKAKNNIFTEHQII
tara:strand:- start:1418 stop:1921 length:504 start_codon:yes stop_codon:yes gene_type:complete